jgi:hypothetical protein
MPVWLLPPRGTMDEITTSEAARSYRTNPVVLLRLITMGKLQARRNPDGSGKWLINRESLERWNSLRKPARAAIDDETHSTEKSGHVSVKSS